MLTLPTKALDKVSIDRKPIFRQTVYSLQSDQSLYSPQPTDSKYPTLLLSTPMGVDYVVIGFDMEVQPLVTHNAA